MQIALEIGSLLGESVRQGEMCGCLHVAAIVLDYRKVLVSTGWAISFLLCTDRIGKCSSHLVETPLLAW